jgi:hypothetical protein
MANGFHRSEARWETLEMPLRGLDEELRTFAERIGAALTSNTRDWPDRSIIWGTSIRRLVQIYLVDESHLKYSFWLCASEDRGTKRYWRKQFLKEAVPIAEIAAGLPDLLEQGRSLLESWTSETLEFATTLSPNPPGRA